jgi:hypothetical protein
MVGVKESNETRQDIKGKFGSTNFVWPTWIIKVVWQLF